METKIVKTIGTHKKALWIGGTALVIGYSSNGVPLTSTL